MKHELITLLNDHPATRSSDAHRPQSGTSAQTAYRDRLACWSLRILSGAGGMPSYVQPGRASLASLSELLAVPELADVAASSHAVSQAIAVAVLSPWRPRSDCRYPGGTRLRHAAHGQLAGAGRRPRST
ncbi:MAG: hypothetical protein IPO43_10305 [Rhodoferax sp.]|nr:hypothetical protein [Rhodoferax sp.]